MITRISLLVVAVAVPLAAILIAWRVVWKRRVREKFAEYREQVTHLSQTLDALQERHKLLPHIDEDFQTPMAGRTLALYQEAEAALVEYRRGWLDLMSVWEKAQSLIEQESFFGVSRYREAERSLAAAGVEMALEAVEKRCREPLDRLEQAHEQAAAELAEAEERSPRLTGRLAEIEQAGLPMEPYRTELAALEDLTAQARDFGRNDPIAALECLAKERRRAAEWNQWVDEILRLRREADEALEQLEVSSSLMNQRRGEGYLLSEPESDPRTPLDEGWRQRQAALEALERGDAKLAAEGISQAVACADEAKQFVERTVAARQSCEQAFVARSVERRRLDDALRQGEARRRELEREFARDSWREVGDHVSRARSLFDQTEAALDEAASLAAPGVQHYLRAAGLVEQCEKERQEAHSLLSAVERRLTELVEIRRKRRDELAELRRRVDRLADTLHRSAADRVRANERCREADRLVRDALDQAEQPRADWPRIETLLKEIARLAEEGERLAQEDFQLARQAADEIAEAEREMQTARGFHRLGITADVSACDRLLDDARRKLHAQEYEDAIRLAARAEKEARQAVAEADRRAVQKQSEIEEEQRRAAAMTAPQQTLAK
jgi:hypothetical protein